MWAATFMNSSCLEPSQVHAVSTRLLTLNIPRHWLLRLRLFTDVSASEPLWTADFAVFYFVSADWRTQCSINVYLISEHFFISRAMSSQSAHLCTRMASVSPGHNSWELRALSFHLGSNNNPTHRVVCILLKAISDLNNTFLIKWSTTTYWNGLQ